MNKLNHICYLQNKDIMHMAREQKSLFKDGGNVIHLVTLLWHGCTLGEFNMNPPIPNVAKCEVSFAI